ncbi:hypothetical protein AVDCRST_MAG81-2325 [uncultured Synechococcales cyanobacterium]|uniref:Uncharacterized protein n=1 Tax=uncultured Synechococcales cyanobacterium TaxID=1936017 RepID=A0A6J4VHF6_9CYAN|nr:hypothetical protein AVDCRST_MAG81-2325 [uncultured Synechococcales cyanobacterium]
MESYDALLTSAISSQLTTPTAITGQLAVQSTYTNTVGAPGAAKVIVVSPAPWVPYLGGATLAFLLASVALSIFATPARTKNSLLASKSV